MTKMAQMAHMNWMWIFLNEISQHLLSTLEAMGNAETLYMILFKYIHSQKKIKIKKQVHTETPLFISTPI